MTFKAVRIDTLDMNPFTKIGKEWLLITAGTADNCNTIPPVGVALAFSGIVMSRQFISDRNATPKRLWMGRILLPSAFLTVISERS